ncbi:MAG: STN domain-containing protein [Acidobacteriota bacterium]|nr:STN domain-containing protein [Acidobacteriota bacterium]
MTPSPLSLVNVPLAEALDSITSSNGLAFVVVDPTTVVIRMRAR